MELGLPFLEHRQTFFLFLQILQLRDLDYHSVLIELILGCIILPQTSSFAQVIYKSVMVLTLTVVLFGVIFGLFCFSFISLFFYYHLQNQILIDGMTCPSIQLFKCNNITDPFLQPGVDWLKDLPSCTMFICTNTHFDLKPNNINRK